MSQKTPISDHSSFSVQKFKYLLDIVDTSKDKLLEASIVISDRYEVSLSSSKLKAVSVAVAFNYYFGSDPAKARKAGSILLREKFHLSSNRTEVRLYNKLVSEIPQKFRNHILYNFRSVLEDHDSLSEESITSLVNHFENHFWDCHLSTTQSQRGSIPLTKWDKILADERSDPDDQSQDSAVTAPRSYMEDHSFSWVFILFDIILRVKGIR
jgi:hypothetical protein